MKLESLVNDVESLIKPSIEEMDYELYHVEYVKENGEFYLRIYIDSPSGISLQDCEKVSRTISDLLDEADPIKDAYYLEVSSPGVNRYLYTPKHYQDNISKKVLVKTISPVLTKKTHEGILKSFNDNEITIENNNEEIKIPLDKIKSVNVEVDF
ncbi:ribosome maturation factor RimP [Clostridium amylolyticum]|uniref:Ribosome maturation factor RimP n=1 Tax=Clostridium amylolyticum TaxID=1121298 RepID=A0A1M6DAQ4_9CLOT|nr:ribosome maturation factor RimP [Clostridium amylolyticum]SHI70342.1 ribosome maturation factor RimP [Clostridium amylolyticum]